MTAPAPALAGSGVSAARRPHQPSPRELDDAHITQRQDDTYLPDGRPWPTNQCGPTAAVNAVRLLGADLPGFAGERTRDVLDDARFIATGSSKDRGTYPNELAHIVTAAGLTVVPATSTDSILARARHGTPTIILGDANARGGFDARATAPKDANDKWGHFVVVSGFNRNRGEYYVDDPGSPGTIFAPASEIRAFKRGWDYEPDISLAPGAAGRQPVKEPPYVLPRHSRAEIKDAVVRARETLSRHDAPAGAQPTNPPVWDRLADAHARTPYEVPYAARAYAKVTPSLVPTHPAPDTRIATARTAHALLGEHVDRQPAGTLDSTLARVRNGATALVRGNSARRGAWDDELVKPGRSKPSWALVHGYLPETREYLVSDPRKREPIHVPASEIRAFDSGAAGRNVVLEPTVA